MSAEERESLKHLGGLALAVFLLCAPIFCNPQSREEIGYRLFMFENRLDNVTQSAAAIAFAQVPPTLVATVDSITPSYRIVAANSSGVTMGNFRLRAEGDSQYVSKLNFQLTQGNPNSIVRLTVWNGSVQVGQAIFMGSNRSATSSLVTPVYIPRGGEAYLAVKADIAPIYQTSNGTAPAIQGDRLKLGLISVSSLPASTRYEAIYRNPLSFEPIRIFKSYPRIATDTLPSSAFIAGKAMRFKVSASEMGSIGIGKFTFGFATSGTSVRFSNINVYAYEDAAYTRPISGVHADGRLLATNLAQYGLVSNIEYEVRPQNASGVHSPIIIPAGITRYFEVRVQMDTYRSGAMLATKLLADGQFSFADMLSYQVVEDQTSDKDNFIWSPHATTTSGFKHTDWTNGFAIPGLGYGLTVISMEGGTTTPTATSTPTTTPVMPTPMPVSPTTTPATSTPTYPTPSPNPTPNPNPTPTVATTTVTMMTDLSYPGRQVTASSTGVGVLQLNLTSSKRYVAVKSLFIKGTGINLQNTFIRLYLYSGSTLLTTTSKPVAEYPDGNIYGFTGLNIPLVPGIASTLTIKADILASTTNKTVSFRPTTVGLIGSLPGDVLSSDYLYGNPITITGSVR